jgi:glycosyltransferase involved in cell wall biosynthesis
MSYNPNITYSLSTPDQHVPTLCLNMIVKNESKIIERLLTSVAPWIDSYCICDTGSTDNTIEIIQRFFESRGIPGKIVQEPFHNFGYNRSFALKACESIVQGADYILLLDADMVFCMGEKVSKQSFCDSLRKADAHYLFQGAETFLYKNVRIVRNRANMSYIGVTHEYIDITRGLTTTLIEKSVAFINDIGDGGSKQDKFLRDIRLLTQGIIDEPQHIIRYTFYLANSYRDSGQPDLAIETYKKRIVLGGWFEEVWQSHYNIGNLYYNKGEHGNAIFHWLEAYHVHPERVENLHKIVQYYRLHNKCSLAYPFYRLAKHKMVALAKKGGTPDYLFVQKEIYDCLMDYEMTILGYYCNTDGYDLKRISMDVLAYPYLSEPILKNVLSNYKFYTAALDKESESVNRGLLNVFRMNIRDLPFAQHFLEQGFVQSTPSIIALSNNRFGICIRYVNYRIDDKGGYVNQSTIETRNVVYIYRQVDQDAYSLDQSFIVKHDTTYDKVYVGIEDIRLFSRDGNTIEYSGNRGMPDDTMQIEMGRIDLASGCTVDVIHPRIPNQGRIEKNWINFWDSLTNVKRTVYGWHPIVIGDIVQDPTANNQPVFSKTHEIATPGFFKHVRGSTHGLVIGDEIWFLCHLVSYEDRRYYYHLAVVLDLATYRLKGYSPLFTFEKKAVEYTLGFVYLEESKTFVIGYSILDRETRYLEVAKTWFDDSMIR